MIVIAEPPPYEWLDRYCLLQVRHRDGVVIQGYGKIQGKPAHRWTWEHHHGPIPPGWQVCHECDDPACIEITHLRLCTQYENVHDAIARGRR